MVRSTAQGRPALWGRPGPAVGSVHRCPTPGRDCLRRRCRQHKAGLRTMQELTPQLANVYVLNERGRAMHSELLLKSMNMWNKVAWPQLFTNQMHATSSKAEPAVCVLVTTADHSHAAEHVKTCIDQYLPVEQCMHAGWCDHSMSS